MMRAMFSAAVILAATVTAGPAWAGGGVLDKEAIRTVVRAHIGEVRECYDAGLQRDPELAGKLVVGFEIAADGAVKRSEISESSLADAQVGACVAAAVRSWTFPAPQGGAVEVAYPFAFEPG